MIPKIGFLGLGKIATSMAANISKNGYKTHAFDTNS